LKIIEIERECGPFEIFLQRLESVLRMLEVWHLIADVNLIIFMLKLVKDS